MTQCCKDLNITYSEYVLLIRIYDAEGLSQEEQKYIWGAQCNLWTEYVLSSDHVEFMLLPRLAAMSEVQWLSPEKKDFKAFEKRLQHTLRMYEKFGYKYCTKYE